MSLGVLALEEDSEKTGEKQENLAGRSCCGAPAVEIEDSDEVLLQCPGILAVVEIHWAPVN